MIFSIRKSACFNHPLYFFLYMLPPLLFYLRLFFRPVVTIIFSIVLAVVFPIVLAVVSLAAHLYLVQYAAEDLASGHCQLVFDPLSETVADLATGEDDHCAVAEFGDYCGVDDASQRRCIDDDHVILHSAYFDHLLETCISQQFTGVGRYRTGEEEMEVRNIRLTDCCVEIHLTDQIIGQSEADFSFFMSASHDTLAQIGVNEDRFLSILCERLCQFIGHTALTFIRRTAGHADDPDVLSGEFDVRAERLKCFLGTEILFFLF